MSSMGKGHSDVVDTFNGGAVTPAAPTPRPLVLAEWDPQEGVGGRIAFFAPSEAVARQVAEGLGELSWTMFGDFPFYQLAVHPCQPFDEVFGFLLQTAGPGGVLEGW